MAYSKKPTYSFEDENSTGINKVPKGRLIVVDSYQGKAETFITVEDTSTLTDTTKIQEALEQNKISRITSGSGGGGSGGSGGGIGSVSSTGYGFGVGVCGDELAKTMKMTGMPGYKDPVSRNYGNYWDELKNVFVFIPKFYFKWEGNMVDVSFTPKAGYVIHRAFINKNKEIDGFFIGKYQFGYGAGKAKSVAGPVYSNQYGYWYVQQANNMGDRYTVINVFMFNALAILSKVQRQSGAICAWNDVAPYYPKGNNNSGRDVNEPSVFFYGSQPAHTGSGSPFAKTTHNGQDCGVCDLNGNTWEFGLGYTCYGSKYYVAKEECDMAKFTHEVQTGAVTTKQCAWGDTAYLENPNGFFKELNVTSSVLSVAGDVHFSLGKGNAQVMPFNSTKGHDDWLKCCMGIPLTNGCTQGTSGGTEEFGNDVIYYVGRKPNHMMPLLGGNYGSAAAAGVWCQTLHAYRTDSYQSWSSRLAAIPE